MFEAGPDCLIQSVFGSDPKYWSQAMKDALGLVKDGCPFQLTLNKNPERPIPAGDFSASAQRVGNVFNKEKKICVTPTEFFKTNFRNIFKDTKITHTTGKEAKKWLAGPNMNYWPQQLNFAVWCATTGFGISREILFELIFSQELRSFYLFHVYFTIRGILFEMSGIQSVSALPGDPTFSQTNNKYDIASYNSICKEFGIDPSSDFRYKSGENHGLGKVFIYVGGVGARLTYLPYPTEHAKFSDEGGKASYGNAVYFIQFDFFVPDEARGLTQAGLSRLNQSIEALVYCLLGSQVNVRSSILGDGGKAKEAQSEFLVLMEDAIRQPDLSKSVQRYQLAVDEAKVRLDFVGCPGTWLMPSRMVINTASKVGYNNQLKQANTKMKLGVNNNVNTETKKVGVRLMDGGHSKVNVPNSHPSNPIHKEAMKGQGMGGRKKEAPNKHACSARKEMTCPAALKMKLTIEPIRPGNNEAAFLPISFRPFPTALIADFNAVIILSTTAPMTKLAAKTTACKVHPYFLNISLTLSQRGRATSLS